VHNIKCGEEEVHLLLLKSNFNTLELVQFLKIESHPTKCCHFGNKFQNLLNTNRRGLNVTGYLSKLRIRTLSLKLVNCTVNNLWDKMLKEKQVQEQGFSKFNL